MRNEPDDEEPSIDDEPMVEPPMVELPIEVSPMLDDDVPPMPVLPVLSV